MNKLIRNFFVNLLGILIARAIIPGFMFQGDVILLLETTAILTVLNFTLRPILKLVFLPLILLTLGLFTFVVNMLILWLITFAPLGIHIQTLNALVLATILFGALNLLLHIHGGGAE
ncbi:MAG: phage holin family protein [Patescibacteria group bacterium]|nr:phage holin family protein [Patescibacteria group bacterium]MDE2438201.1 phage holin family protein [Patescibacteria group bacterium]